MVEFFFGAPGGVIRRRIVNGAALEHVRMRVFAWMINYRHMLTRGTPPIRPYMTFTVPNISRQSRYDVRGHEPDIHHVHTLTNATVRTTLAAWHAQCPPYGWPPSLNQPPLTWGLHTSDLAPARSGTHAPSCDAADAPAAVKRWPMDLRRRRERAHVSQRQCGPKGSGVWGSPGGVRVMTCV